jgi:hypothetical protein
LANVGESGESLPNWLANVGESGESQHFLGFGHFLLAKFAKFAKFAKLQSLEILNESSMLKRLNEHAGLLHSLYLYLVDLETKRF